MLGREARLRDGQTKARIYFLYALIKRNLRRLLHLSSSRILVKCTVSLVRLLLDCSAKLHELLWYGLVCCLQYINESTSQALLVLRKESDSLAVLTCTTSTVTLLASGTTDSRGASTYRPIR